MKNGKRRAGMTLVEGVIASALGALVCLALFAGVSFARYGVEATEQRLVALQYARQELERLRNKAYYDEIALKPRSYALNLPAPYSGTYVVTESILDELKSIRVKVEWDTRRGRRESLELESYLSYALHL